MPDAITSGNYIRYLAQYGQRSLNTSGGDQLFSVHLPNRQYSSITLSALMERVAGSGSTFNFCLDLGNDGTCDWTANSQSFSGPVRLDSSNLKNTLNAYITAQHSAAETLSIPIRVNISTPADLFLFNLVGAVGQDVDLQPGSLGLSPQNGNPVDAIVEGTPINLNVNVKNNGTYKAENFTLAFYLGDPDSGGRLIGSKFFETLSAGATSSTQTVTWNTTGLLGDQTIYVKADASGAMAESNENNNLASANATIKSKPDLVTAGLTLPDGRTGETVNASVSIENHGQTGVTNALVRLYNGTPETGVLLGSTTVDVAGGGSAAAQIPFSLITPGQTTLWIKADPLNTIVESDDTNNAASGNAYTGWNLLTVDAGGSDDTAYNATAGHGWLTQGSNVTTCGTSLEKSYHQAGSSENLDYQFDNLLPGRYYHLDLTFATCSGERWANLFVDGRQVYESGLGQAQSVDITIQPRTVSILLTPADYADRSITLSIRRASGLNGPLVNIIDLQEVRYCYRDSGPGEEPWSTNNGCGYDPSQTSDVFNGWGSTSEQTIRFREEGSLVYKFSSLNPVRKYNIRTTFYEGDGAGRVERLTFDGGSATPTFALGSMIQHSVFLIPPSTYSDGTVLLSVERIGSGEAIVSEVALEENTRLENGRYPLTQTFTDVPYDYSVTYGGVVFPLYDHIQALYDAGYTAGCSTNPLSYCPNNTLTRVEAAVFMLRGLEGTSYAPPTDPGGYVFTDDWSSPTVSWGRSWAEGMWDEGLTSGCQASPKLFCPTTTLTRAEASVFGLRIENGAGYTPPAVTHIFADDWSSPSVSWAEAWAEQAYLHGLLPACGESGGKPLFCPGDLVTRAWAAYLVVEAKDLTLTP